MRCVENNQLIERLFYICIMNLNSRLDSGYITTGELDQVVAECRIMANKLGLVIKWSIKKKTATVYLKYNGSILWQDSYPNDTPHMIIIFMYAGVQAELNKRTKENHDSIIRMRQLELQRIEEKRVMDMPTWQQRRNAK